MDTVFNIMFSPLICIGWLIAGAIAGAAANRIMGGPNQPILIDIVTGLIGAFVGNILLGLLNINRDPNGLDGFIITIIVGIIGAILVIGVVRALQGRRVA